MNIREKLSKIQAEFKSKKSRFNFITDHKDSYLEVVATDWRPQVELVFVKEKGKERKKQIINIEAFISIKGMKAIGNRLTSANVKEINILEPLDIDAGEKFIDERSKDTSPILDPNSKESKEEDQDGQITLELL